MQCCEYFPEVDFSPPLLRNMDASPAHKPGIAEHPTQARTFLPLAVVSPRVGQKNLTPEVILSPYSFTDCLDN